MLPKTHRHDHHTHFPHRGEWPGPLQTLTVPGKPRLGSPRHAQSWGELQNARAGVQGQMKETHKETKHETNPSVRSQGTEMPEEGLVQKPELEMGSLLHRVG